MPIEYFAGVPAVHDQMWCREVVSVWAYCEEKRVLDPGAGMRTLTPDTIRCDMRSDVEAHHVCDATALPFDDNEFDAVFTSHLIEHLPNPIVALREWIRVVQPGGYVCVIVPDTRYTRGQNTDATPHLHEWAPREFLQEVFGWGDGVTPWFLAQPVVTWAPARVVDLGEACPGWSFYVVLQKGEACLAKAAA